MPSRLGKMKIKPVLLGLSIALTSVPGFAEDALDLQRPILPGGIRLVNGRFVSMQDQPVDPSQPTQPIQPVQPVEPVQPVGEAAGPSGGASFGGLENLAGEISAAMTGPAPPPVEGVSGAQISALPAVDLGEVLQQSSNIQTVSVQRRNPVALDPRIRGFRSGQIYSQADGAYYVPVRQDLDTILNKFDPSMIEQVLVVPGPYAVQYGPAFSFIDVITADTPRYECGYEAHNRVGLNYNANGGQVYFRDTYYGGSDVWGFRFGYGNRKGSDYEAGNGVDIPASYQNQNFLAQIGYDLSPWQKVEFRYNRQDQSDTEFPGLFFNTDYLVTDAWNVRVTDEDPSGPWERMLVEGWYNRTRFEGSTPSRHEDVFRVIDRVDTALANQNAPASERFRGFTDGDVTSTGGRTSATFGEVEFTNLTIGTDFRYVEQNINERFTGFDRRGLMPVPLGIGNPPSIDTNLPRAYMTDPGLFTVLATPVTPFWESSIGARVDFVETDVTDVLRGNTQLDEDQLHQDDTLYAFFLNNEIELDDANTARLGIGHGQRVPTLIDRYADGVFLGIIQSGFSRVIGDPTLPKERLWQVDASLQGDYDRFRYRAGVFHSSILDYSTYSVNVVQDLAGARLLQSTATDYATLAGFESAVEYDLTRRLTPFADMSYVEGRDQEINRPLFGISPLESRLGLRWHDPQGGARYGVEFYARIVDNQDRLGTVRVGTTDEVTVLELPTPGFTVWHLRSYYNVSENFNLTAGIDNVFDRTYQEHLDLRLPPDNGFDFARVLAPGFSPYFGFEWTY